MAGPINFGTDGWRAIIAEDFTFANVRICAQATATYLKESSLAGKGMVIGYDTRFASEDFAAAVAEVMAGNGIKTALSPHPTPTPMMSYAVIAREAGGAVVITASHNPARWNGFKLKTQHGTGAPPEVTTALERHIPHIAKTGDIKRMPISQAQKEGLVEYIDPAPAYLKHVESLINLDELRQSKLKVIYDPMYGTGSGYFHKLLDGGNIGLTEINGERNPLFPGIHPEPVAANLKKLAAAVKESRADIGLATDGDADRLGVIDENGVFLTTLQVYALLCLYLLEVQGERGPIVKTRTSTAMLERLGEAFNVPVYEVPVGFKYVAQEMTEKHAMVGGEESGSYGFMRHMLERDGIFSGLYFLDLMAKTGKTPSQLIDYLYSKVGPHHFHRIDLKYPVQKRGEIEARLMANPPREIDGARLKRFDPQDGYKYVLADGAWLLIRFSGTEPVLRIYAESDSPERVNRLIEIGREMADLEYNEGRHGR